MSGDDQAKTNRRQALAWSAAALGAGAAALGAFVAVRVNSAIPMTGDKELPTGADLSANQMIGLKLRVIRPGEFVTMEYDPRRLTVEVDDDDRIRAIRIG